MRKILCVSLLLWNGETAALADGLGGFYLGTSFGVSSIQVSSSYDDNMDEGHAFQNGKNGFLKSTMAVWAGYNFHLNSLLYMGVEGGLDTLFGGETSVQKNQQFETKIQQKELNFSFLGRMGVMVSQNTAIFCGLGMRSTSWQLQSIDIPSQISTKKSHRSFKPHFQVGVEGKFFAPSLGWRVSYGYTPGKLIKITEFPNGHLLGNAGGLAQARCNEHTTSVGLFYAFPAGCRK